MIAIIITIVAVQLISLAIFINEVRKGFSCMSRQIDDLKAVVEQNTSVTKSALALIQGLADKIEAAKDDPAALDNVIAQIRANDAALAEAVTKNTPADTTQPAPTEGNPV